MSDILYALNNKLIVGGVFYDHKEASSCVNHDIPLSKQETYGITGKDKAL
jgi:hypothetical protein